MAQIKLTKRGQTLAARGKSKGGIIAFRKDVFKVYTLKNTGEKILVNESEVFPEKPEYVRRAA